MTYALIQWGGIVAGQRPRTALAYVWEDARGWRAELLNPDGTTRYKRARSIDREEILVEFAGKDMPTPKLVRSAKKQLPIVEENDSRFDLHDSISI